MLIGVMLITLFSLMRHPLFEWRSRKKLAALNDNFKLIVEVILPGIFIFSLSQDMTGFFPDEEESSAINKLAKSLYNLVSKKRNRNRGQDKRKQ